uniref:NADH-ubiquinone oxidoreductase chain 5 n=1 Tax=Scutigera coleoptrata TaxID=29022 RepID=Q70XS2_SCUCO|nr:NADH dehydrogenase subunit 5 [Scutigera coleoptrata]CAE01477.1 NADH dehydrogenase subunit 5 [Scutigera coleoptrata]
MLLMIREYFKVGSIFLMFLSLLSFLFGIWCLMFEKGYFLDWEFFYINGVVMSFSVIIDYMSMIFMSFVMFISSNVLYYSIDYMSGELNSNRFCLLVLMFVLSMILLIISPNLISILLGWDGLGLVSYCLVIYYQNSRSFNAGMLTVLSNRIGDVALLISIAWMFNYGNWNYLINIEMGDKIELWWVGLCVLVAAMTKSAQIPFSAWLPAAMAAPTPVSALVHSSTLVTAGVYLLIRFDVMFSEVYVAKSMLFFFSVFTMFMAGLGANFEYDLKKIIALSTLSQLGLMMFVLSMGYSMLAFFHLLTHALFKALLFLCAGGIIHSMGDNQDIRVMGSLSNNQPFLCSCFNVANLALCGMPFLAGFYSKDMILEMCMMSNFNTFMFFITMLSTGLTVSYSFRLVNYVVSGDWKFKGVHMLGDVNSLMGLPMFNLMLGGVVMGSVLSWLVFGDCSVAIYLYGKIMVVIVSGVGFWLGNSIEWMSVSLKSVFIDYFGGMWFMPMLSTQFSSYFFLWWGDKLIMMSDQSWSEEVGPQGVFSVMVEYSILNQWIQNNSLKVYLSSFLVWFFIIMVMCV